MRSRQKRGAGRRARQASPVPEQTCARGPGARSWRLIIADQPRGA